MAGRSATRNPCVITPISSSDAWYCGCSRRTAPVTSARMARSPKVVSVIRWPVSTLIVSAKTRTPSFRTGSLVSSLPSVREPVTKSAWPARIGAIRLLDLGRVVLAVGVGGHDVARAALPGEPVAEPQRRALAPVDRHVADQRARLPGLLDRGVDRAVGDDDRHGVQAAHGGGQVLDDRADRAFLVEGGDHDGDRRQPGGPVTELLGERPDRRAVDGLVVADLSGHFASENSGQTVDRPDLRSCVGR